MVEKSIGSASVASVPLSRCGPCRQSTPPSSNTLANSLHAPRKAGSLVCPSLHLKSEAQQRPASCTAPVPRSSSSTSLQWSNSPRLARSCTVPIVRASSSSSLPRSKSPCSKTALSGIASFPQVSRKSRSPSPVCIVGQHGPRRRQRSPHMSSGALQGSTCEHINLMASAGQRGEISQKADDLIGMSSALDMKRVVALSAPSSVAPVMPQTLQKQRQSHLSGADSHLDTFACSRHSQSSSSLPRPTRPGPNRSSSFSTLSNAVTTIPSVTWPREGRAFSNAESIADSMRSGQIEWLNTPPTHRMSTGICVQDCLVGPQAGNAEVALATWLSEKTQLIVRGALVSLESACSAAPPEWNAEAVRRFGIHVLSAHGIDPPHWQLPTWLDIHSTVNWSVTQNDRPHNFQHAENLARRIFEHLVGQANYPTIVASSAGEHVGKTMRRLREVVSTSSFVEPVLTAVPAVTTSSTASAFLAPTGSTNVAVDSTRTIKPESSSGGVSRKESGALCTSISSGDLGKVAWRGKLSDPTSTVQNTCERTVGTTSSTFSVPTQGESSHVKVGLTFPTMLSQGKGQLIARVLETSVPSSSSSNFLAAAQADGFFDVGQSSLNASTQDPFMIPAAGLKEQRSACSNRVTSEELETLRDNLAREREDNKAAWQSLASFVEELFDSTKTSSNVPEAISKHIGEDCARLREKVMTSIAAACEGNHVSVEHAQGTNEELSLVSSSEEPSAVLKAIQYDGLPLCSPLDLRQSDDLLSSPVRKGRSSGISPIRASPSLESSPPLSMSQEMVSWTSAVLGATPLSIASLGEDDASPQCFDFSGLGETHDKKLAAARATLIQLDRDLASSSPQRKAANEAYKLAFYRQKCTELFQKELQLQEEVRRRDAEVLQLQEALNKTRGILLGTPEANRC